MNVQKPDPEPSPGFEAEVSRSKVKVKMSERVAIVYLIPLSVVLAGLIWTWWVQRDFNSLPFQQPQMDQHQQRD
jgi:hypothetical protein